MEKVIKMALSHILKPVLNLSDTVQSFLVTQNDEIFWIKYGLLPKTVKKNYEYRTVSNGKLTDLVLILTIIRNGISILLGWEAEWFQKYSGDVFAGFGSKSVWFLFHFGHTFECLVLFFTPWVCRYVWSHQRDTSWKSQWTVVFDGIYSDEPDAILRISDKKITSKLLLFSRTVFLILKLSLVSLPIFFSVFFSLVFCYRFLALETVLISFCACVFFLVGAISLISCVIVPLAYFVVFCCYAFFRSRYLLKKTKLLTRTQDLVHLTRDLQKLVDEQSHLSKQIKQCNHLYRNITTFMVSPVIIGILIAIYGMQDAENWIGKLFFLSIAISGLAMMVLYFVAGDLVTTGLKANYQALANCFAVIAYNDAFAFEHVEKYNGLSISTQWHVLLMLESLSSKRNKIGFSCLHWFRFSSFSLLKVSY